MPFKILDRETLKKMGFGDLIKDIENGICPNCKKKVDVNSFTSDFCRSEFELCGYCERCTIEMMGEVIQNVNNSTCFRCGETISMSDFETDFELNAYYKMGVCGKCQRNIVKYLK
jgi:uncharacterized CHY-type Zn-finger protein